MKLKTLFLPVLIFLSLSFPASSLEKDSYYICFDNSWSMKRFDFYPRLIGSLIAHLKREGEYGAVDIKFIPFGTKQTVKIIGNYNDFSQYIKKTFSTTDFQGLSGVLDGVDPGGTVIIISDGEHDMTDNDPFTHLAETELKQMIEVANQIKSKHLQVHGIHILKHYSHIKESRDITNYYNDLRRRNRSALPGTETAVTDGKIIAGLSRDFMQKVASENCYYSCAGNVDAVKTLLEIFNISLTFQCDASGFIDTVPLRIDFEMVDSKTRDWLWREIENRYICIDGVRRKFVKNQADKDFKLNVEYINNNVYTVRLDYETIWKEQQIFTGREMENCVDSIVNGIRTKIKNEFSNDPRFTVPGCLISIKFLDRKLYAFLSRQNFKLHIQTCDPANPETWEDANVSFFEMDNRAFLEVPMIASDRLFITLPGQNDNYSRGLSIDLSPRIINSWDAAELTIQNGAVRYPAMTYDFSGFLGANNGALLFFAANTRRFYGMVGNNLDCCQLELFKGRRYKIYFVPEEIDEKNIKSTPKNLGDTTDIQDAISILTPTAADIAFSHWEECLDKFKNADPAGGGLVDSRDMVTRQIAASNGYFLVLQHLGEIKSDDEKRRLFRELLERTVNIYTGMESPFEAIDLLQAEIPGFSRHLKDRYLGMGDRGKMQTIILVLSNPIMNLTQLKHYIDGNLKEVTMQNQKYFKELEK